GDACGRPRHQQHRRIAGTAVRQLDCPGPPCGASRPRRLAATGNSARFGKPGRHGLWMARGGACHTKPRVSPGGWFRLRTNRRIACAGPAHWLRRSGSTATTGATPVTHARSRQGFTLVELLVALLVLSLLALTSYRGLSAVLDARQHVSAESEKWRRVAAFF